MLTVTGGRLTVSVAVPCYNGAPFVGRTIESLLDQSRAADELLVVDDGSTDGSAGIIQRYPVRLIQHATNQGLSAARNSAIAAAAGDILVFVDVDATADHDLLRVLLSGYEDPRVAGVGGQGIEANVRSLADRWRRAHASQNHGERPRFVEYLYGLCMSFRRGIVQQIGGFNVADRTNAEDLDIGLRLTRAGHRLYYLPAARVYHQRNDDVASLQRSMAAWYRAAYQVKRRNRSRPWTLFAGTARRLVADPLSDLLTDGDSRLACLSWQIHWHKLKVLWQTATQKQDGTQS